MNEERKEVFAFLSSLLSDLLSENETLTEKTLLRNDIGLDSLDSVDLLMTCEMEYKIRIPDAEVEKLETIGDCIDCICKYRK